MRSQKSFSMINEADLISPKVLKPRISSFKFSIIVAIIVNVTSHEAAFAMNESNNVSSNLCVTLPSNVTCTLTCGEID